MWNGAITKKNTFNPINLSWKMHPERDMEWYLKQLRDLGEKRVAQEIDCHFLKSGYNVFNMDMIKKFETISQERCSKASLNRFKFYTCPYTKQVDAIVVHTAINKTKQYIIGADVATGSSRDYSAYVVMDTEGVS